MLDRDGNDYRATLTPIPAGVREPLRTRSMACMSTGHTRRLRLASGPGGRGK